METSIEFQSASNLPPQELIDLINRCFEGYLVKIHLDQPALLGMIRVDSVDLNASVVAVRDGRRVGIAMVSRRGWSSRLAAMGIDPESRGQGVGSGLVAELLRQARQRGDREYVLETIEQNLPAVRLYESAGFKTVRRLRGYGPGIIAGAEAPDLEEIDSVRVSQMVASGGLPDLPWQIAASTMALVARPHHAFRLGPAAAILTDPTGPVITFRSLMVEPEFRRKGWGTRLVRAVATRFPGKKLRFSPHVPEEIPAGFFLRLGLEPDALNQLQMGIRLV
jgi:ribosomal protein S18 acetylase RimI-like enzyme